MRWWGFRSSRVRTSRLTTRIVDALRAADAGDIAVVVGGTIPQADVQKLLDAGAAAVFPTGTPLDTLVRDVRALTEKARLEPPNVTSDIRPISQWSTLAKRGVA